ncbi:MAG: alanine--tRNA ligase [Deltaproteobacteria bacterium]|nr:alanine--tRNA ligase [Deltaproteobacteria bacterium]
MSLKRTYDVPYLTCDEIRNSYIEFFKARQHRFIPSSGLAPQDDPTLLFTNAGMNQFKAIFLGDNSQGIKRAVNMQKCLRVSGKHNDLNEVGRDSRHHTFFEMMGNWSFGDYFKKEAIFWAWELLTKVWKLPKERIFVTVYKDDDEAFDLWKNTTDIHPSHILRFTEDNFWEMGAIGPCGPCTEIIFDTGDLSTQEITFRDPIHGINGKNDRYLEIWNLVFIQFERKDDGSLSKLPQGHVDTGAGLERLCAVIQGLASNYETDLFSRLTSKIAELSGTPYEKGEKGLPHRVIADHVRAVSFAISDGVTPGNEGRGYVIRRILRRASRFAHSLGQKEPFLYKLVPTVVAQMKGAYPDLEVSQAYISHVVEAEEARFLRTLEQGLARFAKLIEKLNKQGLNKVPGGDVFLLHDTYGFPVDLTQILAEEAGLSIDEESYHAHMEEQKERARQAAKFDASLGQDMNWQILIPIRDTKFLGYETLSSRANVTRYREDGDHIFVCLDQTPFYAEAGGQIGDIGILENNNLELRVEDTFKAFELHIHRCSLLRGLLSPDNLRDLTAQVDQEARFFTVRHHSVTHLLHAALKQVLGPQLNQKGSYVGPDRLRFDFTFPRKLTREEIERVEDIVNLEIQKNNPITTKIKKLDEAKEEGALALFGEKYGESVRVLTMGDFSKELCGGTHAKATGDMGVFTIVSESSIAAGVRRIEALASVPAFTRLRTQAKFGQEAADALKTSPDLLVKRIGEVQAQIKALEKELTTYKSKEQSELMGTLFAKHRKVIGPYSTVVTSLSSIVHDSTQLNGFLNQVASHLDKDVAILTHIANNRLNISVLVGKGALGKVKAPEILSELCKVCEGRGGGRPDRAQGASPRSDMETSVLDTATNLLAQRLT